jgi:hypothetical protein
MGALEPARAEGPEGHWWERVAQPVEHVTFNHGVEGSSPSALTNLYIASQQRANVPQAQTFWLWSDRYRSRKPKKSITIAQNGVSFTNY